MKLITNILKLFLIFPLYILGSSLYSQNPFIENKGQFPKEVKAKINLPSGVCFIENTRLVYALYSNNQLKSIHNLNRTEKNIDAYAYTANFLDCNTDILTDYLHPSNYYENYYLGDQSTWAKNVRSYQKITQKNIYDGVDVKYYIEQDKLKYDIVVHPKGQAKKIKIEYNGVKKINLEKDDLHILTTVGEIKEKKPYAYQVINETKVEVLCVFKLKNNILSFDFPEGYNSNYKLIIDPILEFSTYSGSSADNFGYTATYDNLGFLYAGSTCFGPGYPTTLGAYQINYANNSGGTDIAITKYDTTGTQRIYSTYLGGSMDELPHSMIVNNPCF